MEDYPNPSKDTVLVTGATGFLGEYLVRRLTGKYRVLALGRNRDKGRYLEKLGAVFCLGDFTDESQCARYFQDARFVIHAGALSSVWGTWDDFYQTNVAGTALVAKLCYQNKIKRLVYVSSPSIYSEKADRLSIREEQTPRKNMLNYYIQSKLMAEREIRRWNKRGLETVILRPRGLIGIGDTSLVPRLMRANRQTGIPLFRNGNNLVDLTSVENAALACELAMTAQGAQGQAFNITNGEPAPFQIRLEQFLDAAGEPPRYRNLPFPVLYCLAKIFEWAYPILHISGEPPLTRYTVCTLAFAQTLDIRRARETLKYEPEKTLAESIGEYGKWWKENARQTSRKNALFRKKAGKPRHSPKKTFAAENGPALVTQVKPYACGYCTNNLAFAFRRRPWEKRQFPAAAFWIHHKKLGNLLYDTGYSEQIFQQRPFLILYRLLNPVTLTPRQTICRQLQADGIRPESIKTILLSHAHPDHIGGLSQFPGYRLVAFKETLDRLENPKARMLMDKGLLPHKSCIIRKSLPKNQLYRHFLCSYFEQVYDLLGDGSIIGVRLDGHVKGQLGLWIPDKNLFLAADACWGNDLISSTRHMRWLPRSLQEDFSQYQDTLRQICRLKQDYPQIHIWFSHEPVQKGHLPQNRAMGLLPLTSIYAATFLRQDKKREGKHAS